MSVPNGNLIGVATEGLSKNEPRLDRGTSSRTSEQEFLGHEVEVAIEEEDAEEFLVQIKVPLDEILDNTGRLPQDRRPLYRLPGQTLTEFEGDAEQKAIRAVEAEFVGWVLVQGMKASKTLEDASRSVGVGGQKVAE